jgi:ubiquinone biosynthesis protein
MLVAIVGNDAGRLTALVTRLGNVPPDVDATALSSDIAEFLSYHTGVALRQLELGKVLTEFTEIVRRHHIVLPAGVALLLRVLVLLEGTSRLLNPCFKLTELMQPYERRLLWRRLSPARRLQKLRRLYHEWQYVGEVLPRGIVDVLRQVQRGRFTVHLEHEHLEPAVNRLVFGMLTSALFLGSALLWSRQIPPLLGGVSVMGVAGCTVSAVLGLRLLWAINRSGHLDR